MCLNPGLFGEVTLGLFEGAVREGGEAFGMVNGLCEGAGEGFGIVGRNEQGGLIVELVGYAADTGGDAGLVRGDGFENGKGKIFNARAENKDVDSAEKFVARHEACEGDGISQFVFMNELLQGVFFGSIASDQEADSSGGGWVAFAKELEGLEQEVLIFFGAESAQGSEGKDAGDSVPPEIVPPWWERGVNEAEALGGDVVLEEEIAIVGGEGDDAVESLKALEIDPGVKAFFGVGAIEPAVYGGDEGDVGACGGEESVKIGLVAGAVQDARPLGLEMAADGPYEAERKGMSDGVGMKRNAAFFELLLQVVGRLIQPGFTDQQERRVAARLLLQACGEVECGLFRAVEAACIL